VNPLSRLFNVLSGYPRQFKLMFWGMLISTVGSSMIWPFLMIYVKNQVQLPLSSITFLMSINAATGVISALLAGPITDRLGRKGIFVFSLVGNGLVYLFYSQANTLPAFAVLMGFSGVFNPMYRVSADAMLADLIPPPQRADAYALIRLSNNAGIAIGPSLGGFLTVLSYTVAFFFAAGGLITYGLIILFLAHETLPDSQPTTFRETFIGYFRVLRDRPFLAYVFIFILVQMSGTMMWVLLPVHAYDNYGIPESQYGFIPTTNALMVVLFQVFVTRITRKYPSLPTMALGSLLYALGVGSVALGKSFIAFWFSMVIMTLGELILMPTASTYVAHLAPVDMRGRYMSVSGLTWNVAYGTAPVFGGWLGNNISTNATWIGALITGLLGAAGFTTQALFYKMKNNHNSEIHQTDSERNKNT
jgi:MFS family permease